MVRVHLLVSQSESDRICVDCGEEKSHRRDDASDLDRVLPALSFNSSSADEVESDLRDSR